MFLFLIKMGNILQAFYFICCKLKTHIINFIVVKFHPYFIRKITNFCTIKSQSPLPWWVDWPSSLTKFAKIPLGLIVFWGL